MKKLLIAVTVFFFIAGLTHSAYADLDSFLSKLNTKAKSDLNSFGVNLSAQFKVPLPQVRAIINTVDLPADAFMCLQLSQMTHIQLERVVHVYQNQKGQGWGAIAKELGIKPGSAEFHALKKGNFTYSGESSGKAAKEKGKAKGKGKGRKK